jgi:hypothetical protein
LEESGILPLWFLTTLWTVLKTKYYNQLKSFNNGFLKFNYNWQTKMTYKQIKFWFCRQKMNISLLKQKKCVSVLPNLDYIKKINCFVTNNWINCNKVFLIISTSIVIIRNNLSFGFSFGFSYGFGFGNG